MIYVERVKARFPAIAGVTLAFLAFICLLNGVIALGVFLSTRASLDNRNVSPDPRVRRLGLGWYYLQLVWGIVGLVAFVLGLAGGVAALKKVHFRLVIAGSFAVVAWSLLAVEQVLISQKWPPYDATAGFVFAFLVAFFAVLSLTITVISRREEIFSNACAQATNPQMTFKPPLTETLAMSAALLILFLCHRFVRARNNIGWVSSCELIQGYIWVVSRRSLRS